MTHERVLELLKCTLSEILYDWDGCNDTQKISAIEGAMLFMGRVLDEVKE